MAGWIHEEEEEKEDGKKTRSVMGRTVLSLGVGLGKKCCSLIGCWVRNAVISLGVG